MYFPLVDIIYLFTDLLTRLIPVNTIANYGLILQNLLSIHMIGDVLFFRMRVGLHVFGHVISQISGNFLKI